jgi:hypothetical protein
MSWFDLPDDTATPELERLTRRYRNEQRPTPSVIAAMKPAPRTLRAVIQMNNAVTFGGSSLGPRREELLSTAVSALNDCFY